MNRRDFIRTTLAGAAILPSAPPLLSVPGLADEGRRKRLRELGVIIGDLAPGPFNAITDVRGVRVGHTTIIKGQGKGAARTGVTVLLPHEGNIYEERLFASSFGLNGWGEMTGLAAIEETGLLATPIFLTGTYNVGIVQSAALAYLRKTNPELGVSGGTVHPVVAECFDDFLSDTPSRPISAKDVFTAIENAAGGPVAEGAVGGGTGMTSFGFKGGIGTSSRKIKSGATVGVLVMANTGGRRQLRIDGAPVGREIRGYEEAEKRTKSIILIAATDAPLLSYQLKKIAKRVALGLARVGAISGTGSGDIILSFSTANRVPRVPAGAVQNIRAVNDFLITPLYQATVEATQEAILNALTSAGTVVGKDGNTSYGIPLDQVERIMKKYRRLGE
jgi:D-aminopeptidase